MPRIPQYERSVAPQNTPSGYVQANVTPETFGAGIGKALNNIAQAGLYAADEMTRLKERYDRTKLFELSNTLDNWSFENLHDKDKGYLYKTGKDAMGKSQDILNNYDKYSSEVLSKYSFMGQYETQARSIIQGKRRSIQYYAEAHDKKESDKWQDSVFSDAISNVLSKAYMGRNNEPDLIKFHNDGYTVLDNYAITKNLSEEQISMLKKDFDAKFHSQILNGYLAEGSLKAKGYFEKYKDKFTPEMQTSYIQKIRNEEIDYNARITAQSLIGKSTEDAYKYIDNIQNTNERNAVESEYNRLLRHQSIIQEQKDAQLSNEIMQKVFYAFDKGENISEIMREVNISDMSLDQKEKIYSNLKTMQELQGVGNNWADYNILLDMATYNNEQFKKVNPANYNLTKEQYNSILEMQRKSVNNEYTPETELRKAIDGMYSGFNWQTKNGIQKSEYEEEVIKYLAKVERMQGKAFDLHNKAQLEAIMKGFEYKNPNVSNANLDETKELFTRAKKHGEAYDLMAREYMLFKSENKREPNPEEMYEMAKRTYNTIENNYRANNMSILKDEQGLYQNVSNTTPKKGETKILTYYADVRIPQISREIGIPLRVTSRYREDDSGGHGKGRKLDIGMSTFNENQRIKVFERLLSDKGVASIGTSDPVLLKRFNSPQNPKIRDLREYDTNYKKKHPNTTMNHVNHIDVSLDTRYGGDEQRL